MTAAPEGRWEIERECGWRGGGGGKQWDERYRERGKQGGKRQREGE